MSPENKNVRFTYSSIKLPPFSSLNPNLQHQSTHQTLPFNSLLSKTKHSIDQFLNSVNTHQKLNPNPLTQFINSLKHHTKGLISLKPITWNSIINNRSFPILPSPLIPQFVSASLVLTRVNEQGEMSQLKGGGGGQLGSCKHDEERVLISEMVLTNKHGLQLVTQVKPKDEFQGLVCEGANLLPSKFIEDALCDGCGKVVNIRRLEEVITSINSWYRDRGLSGLVSGAEIISGNVVRLQVSEAEVNDISVQFPRRTGEPTVGKTRPETILRQLTTKKGQVYSMLQGKRDVDTLLAIGFMEDAGIIPQPAVDTGKVDSTINVVERVSGGISAGGGISSGITSGPLAGLIGRCAIYHRNLFGRNQKVNLSLERGQIDSIFNINYLVSEVMKKEQLEQEDCMLLGDTPFDLEIQS